MAAKGTFGATRPAHPLRCLIVADRTALIGVLTRVIGKAFSQAMLHFASTPVSARLMLQRLVPDWVVLDLDMHGGTGDWRQLIAVAQTVSPVPLTVVAASRSSDERILQALRAGASAYLVESTAPDAQVERLSAFEAGVLPLDATLALQMARHLETESGGDPPAVEGWEILNWVATGDSLAQAAERLNMPPEVAWREVNGLYQRFGLKLACAPVARSEAAGGAGVAATP